MHLTSSRFFGGPERQMLGLAAAATGLFETAFASFSEGGLCRDLLSRAAAAGFSADELAHDTPRFLGAMRDIHRLLRDRRIDVLLCHGYKAGLLGWRAARRAGIPVAAVSRGWTGENRKVKFYEWIDKRVLKRMDRVICVSQAQAEKVRRCGVAPNRIAVIPNGIDADRFANPDIRFRDKLEHWFGPRQPQPTTVSPSSARLPIRPFIIGAAGRLSPEKGFDLLIAAVRSVITTHPHARLVIFGDGVLRQLLESQINSLGLNGQVFLAGFHSDFDAFLPHLDLFVQSSHTEGMPNVVMEAVAARVPVVATDVGGTREILESIDNARLVAPGSVDALAEAMRCLADRSETPRMPTESRGTGFFSTRFSFHQQAKSYYRIIVALQKRTSDGSDHDFRGNGEAVLVDPVTAPRPGRPADCCPGADSTGWRPATPPARTLARDGQG